MSSKAKSQSRGQSAVEAIPKQNTASTNLKSSKKDESNVVTPTKSAAAVRSSPRGRGTVTPSKHEMSTALGVPGNHVSDASDLNPGAATESEEEFCDVEFKLDEPATFRDTEPHQLNFRSRLALPTGSRAAELRKFLELNHHIYFEIIAILYYPLCVRKMRQVWKDVERVHKLEAFVKKYITVLQQSDAEYIACSHDEMYMRVFRPANFLEQHPDAVEYLEKLRRQTFVKMLQANADNLSLYGVGIIDAGRCRGFLDYEPGNLNFFVLLQPYVY